MMSSRRLVAMVAVAAIVVSACSNAASSGTPAPAPSGSQPAAATTAPTTAPQATPAPPITSYPRAQTLYTSGKQWGAPSTWNPLDPNAAMGVVGLQYETLFLFDPFTLKYTPWLAAAEGTWDSTGKIYTVKTRTGVKWSDGQDFSAQDVAFTLGLAVNVKALGSPLAALIASATASDATTVVVTFKDIPPYQEWQQWLYNSPIVPEHVWKSKANEDILKETNKNGIGTGPYTYKTAADDRMVWEKNPNWWAKTALNMDVAPTYIVDMVNSTNSAALGHVIAGDYDLNNNYLPGISTILSSGGYGNVVSYFDKAPYMLAGNTATLIPNLAHKPLDDKAFRKALATSINIDDIINKDYGGIVTKADVTGLLPYFDQYINKDQAKSLGFSYNKDNAKKMLADAGYKDVNGDGFVENKDGSPIKLNLEVPDGWSDWMIAENIIAASAKAAGINIVAAHPDFNTVVADRQRPDANTPAKFDLIINNDVQVSNTPWTWYDYVFHMPLMYGAAENRNFQGYSNDAGWKLTQQLDQTQPTDVAKMKDLTSQLQKMQLEDMPVIPLWYNGVWAQMSNSVWTNWPSDKGTHALPATWNGYWQMGAILMLTNLKPVPPAK